MTVLTPERIREFWVWFADRADGMRSDFIERGQVDTQEIQRSVESLGLGLRWEIGPSSSDDDLVFFALSPGGHPEKLRATETIVRAAPPISGWEFLDAKPPKVWMHREIQIPRGGGMTTVSFARWLFSTRTRQIREGSAAVVQALPPPGVHEEFTKIECENLLWMFLDSEFGERWVLERVADVEILSASVPDMKSADTLQRLLASDLKS